MAKRIVINASAAKFGGAKSIVESFCAWMAMNDTQTKCLLLAPFKPEVMGENIQYEKMQTSGISSILFSCIGIFWWCFKFKATHCLSFNNVNLIFPLVKRITYFHQAKVFSERSLRFRLISLAISCLRGSTIIVQSPLIRQRFIGHFSEQYKLQVKWPGVGQAATTSRNDSDVKKNMTFLWPVTDPMVQQKNLEWLRANQHWFQDNGVEVEVTSDGDVGLPFVKPIGRLSRPQLYQRYRDSDVVLIVSSEETLCLPIFEAASVGARVFVLDQPYIRSIEQWRGLPEGVSVFTHSDELPLSRAKNNYNLNLAYFEADWQIY